MDLCITEATDFEDSRSSSTSLTWTCTVGRSGSSSAGSKFRTKELLIHNQNTLRTRVLVWPLEVT